MKLIVGLGNPGMQYEKTRHNTGFMAIDAVALKYGLNFNKNKFNGLYCEFMLNGQKFINLSGDVLIEYIKYFKIDINDILVICDDMSLEAGEYKLRYKGGSAGHNGLKNIEANLKTNEYKRLKIGISKNDIDVVNYVLGKFSKEELTKVESVINLVPNIINDFTILTFENLMNKYN